MKSLLLALTALVLLLPSPVVAEDAPEVIPDVESVPSSLSRALKKFRDDQRFQDLREERIELLQSIPELRNLVTTNETKLAEIDAEIANLQSRLRASESAVESQTLVDLRSDLRRMQTEDDVERSRLASAQERLTELQEERLEQATKLEGLRATLSEARTNLASAVLQRDQAISEERKLRRALDAKETELRGLVSILEMELKDGLDVDLEDLASKRRELLAVQTSFNGPEVIAAVEAVSTAETNRELQAEAVRIAELETKKAEEKALSTSEEILDIENWIVRNNGDLLEIAGEIETLEKALERQLTLEQQSADSPENIQAMLDVQSGKRVAALEAVQSAKSNLQTAVLRQTTVENEINDLFVPRSAENTFKLWMSFAFALLVGLVIWKFFQVTREDEKVRRVVFSAEAGIQFVTLFSLVIAIILFGITGILEGKELSALLGGISGYILGRSTPVLKAAADPGTDPAGGGMPAAAPAAPAAPQQPGAAPQQPAEGDRA